MLQDEISIIVRTYTIDEKIDNPESAIDTILDNSYKSSKAEFFKDETERENYKRYLRTTFRDAKQAYNEIYMQSNEKGEDDVKTILE